jgi:hypothetical protein
MKKRLLFIALTLFIFGPGCKSKKGDTTKDGGAFPILSYIQSQIAHVDTSLYQIIKLTQRDSINWDTTYIKREEFRGYAKDFLELPDLAQKKYADKFEESKFFDATLNQAVFSYTPKDKNNEIQREEITIEPGTDGKDKVKNIFADRIIVSADSTVSKRLLWVVDEGFQVTTIIQKTGQPESINTLKINWN